MSKTNMNADKGDPGRKPRPSQPGAAPAQRFSPNSIILPLQSATLRDAVDELMPKALHGAGDVFLKSAKIAESLKKSLGPRCVESHHGLVFIHHRLKDISGPRMALGISPTGLQPEGEGGTAVFVAALFLSPLHEQGGDIPLWAKKTMCDERMIYQLRTAPDLAAVLALLAAP